MNHLEKFVLEYNGVRNANFVMWGALLTTLARERGADGEAWLAKLRALSLKELDAARMQNPADEFTSEAAQIAEIARSVIGATFEMATDRHKK